MWILTATVAEAAPGTPLDDIIECEGKCLLALLWWLKPPLLFRSSCSLAVVADVC